MEGCRIDAFEPKVRVPIRTEDLYVPLRAFVDLRQTSPVTYASAEAAGLDETLGESQEEITLLDASRRAEE